MTNTKEGEKSFREIFNILYPTGLNPKGLPNAEACKLLEELDKVEPLEFQSWICDSTPQGMWIKSFRDLAYMGRHSRVKLRHHYLSRR